MLLTRIVLLMTFFLSSAGVAATPANTLSAQLNHIKTMRADFAQTVTTGRGKVLQSSRGQMMLSRPGKFRWLTKNPTEQLIIADGKTLWIYDKDLEQVSVKPQKKSLTGQPARFLSGDANAVLHHYHVREQSQHFILTPQKKDAPFKHIDLFFSKKKLVRMILQDNLGQKTDLRFDKIMINSDLGNNVFHFVVPAGVDVINADK